MQEPIVSIFSGRASRYLAERIAEYYGKPLGISSVIEFSDGEFQPSFEENIRGRDVFLIQSTFPPTENLMELLLMIDAAMMPHGSVASSRITRIFELITSREVRV